MSDVLPPPPILSAFLAASVILAITPGPAVFYIVTRSLMQGRRSGLASVAGVALGNLGNAVGASVGLAAVFAVSSVAFTVVKYAGALYLVYLGAQALRARRPDIDRALHEPVRVWNVFRDGFVVALLNPKTTVFFAAFLPQFMNTEATPILQSIALGSLFVAIAAVTDTVYAAAASAVGPTLSRAGGFRALGRYVAGGALIGLGVFTAFAGTRGAK